MSVIAEARQETETVANAFQTIAPYVRRTPLTPYSQHDMGGNELWVKDEGLQHARTFKSRGAIALMHALREEGKTKAITASAGNAGAGYAYAAQRLGMYVEVVVPHGTPESKIENIRHMGGAAVKVLVSGSIVDESVDFAMNRAMSEGLVYAPPFNHQTLIAGQGTMTLEALRQRPDTDRIFVPVGGGSALAGALLAAKETGSHAKVVGVQFGQNQSMLQSVLAGEVAQIEAVDTLCEGSSVRSVGALTLRVVLENLDRLELMSVGAEEIGEELSHQDRWRQELAPVYGSSAFQDFPETTGVLAIAGARAYSRRHPELRGESWTAMMTGANSDPTKVDAAIDKYYRSLRQTFGSSTRIVR
jgi:threonine dehydratase